MFFNMPILFVKVLLIFATQLATKQQLAVMESVGSTGTVTHGHHVFSASISRFLDLHISATQCKKLLNHINARSKSSGSVQNH